MKALSGQAKKQGNFAVKNANAKSPMQLLVLHIAREVRRQKLDYHQLKHVFQSVREKCEVSVPVKGKLLVELPTKVELDVFYSAIENPVHKLMFLFLHGTGLRVAELCALEASRIDLVNHLVFVREGKGSRDRVTVVGRKLAERIAIYLEGRNYKYLFETNRGERYSTRRIEQLCKKYKEKAGVSAGLTPHTFRKIWNSALALYSLSEDKRAVLAGHEDLSTQRIYTRLTASGFKDEVIQILDKLID
jgi:integrase